MSFLPRIRWGKFRSVKSLTESAKLCRAARESAACFLENSNELSFPEQSGNLVASADGFPSDNDVGNGSPLRQLVKNALHVPVPTFATLIKLNKAKVHGRFKQRVLTFCGVGSVSL